MEPAAASLNLVSNLATTDASTVGERTWNKAFDSDQEIYVKNVDNAKIELACRVTGENTTSMTGYWVILFGTGSTVLDIYKVVNNSFTFLSEPTGITYAANDVWGVSVVGSTINVYQNSIPVGSLSDSSILGGGKIGMKVNGSGRVDNFGGGTIPPTKYPHPQLIYMRQNR